MCGYGNLLSASSEQLGGKERLLPSSQDMSVARCTASILKRRLTAVFDDVIGGDGARESDANFMQQLQRAHLRGVRRGLRDRRLQQIERDPAIH